MDGLLNYSSSSDSEDEKHNERMRDASTISPSRSPFEGLPLPEDARNEYLHDKNVPEMETVSSHETNKAKFPTVQDILGGSTVPSFLSEKQAFLKANTPSVDYVSQSKILKEKMELEKMEKEEREKVRALADAAAESERKRTEGIRKKASQDRELDAKLSELSSQSATSHSMAGAKRGVEAMASGAVSVYRFQSKSSASAQTGGGTFTASGMGLEKGHKEKVTAKERVKQQRIAGQSGIGSDFREWRSEEEMRMRQQYD